MHARTFTTSQQTMLRGQQATDAHSAAVTLTLRMRTPFRENLTSIEQSHRVEGNPGLCHPANSARAHHA